MPDNQASKDHVRMFAEDASIANSFSLKIEVYDKPFYLKQSNIGIINNLENRFWFDFYEYC